MEMIFFSIISLVCAAAFFYLGIKTISLDRKNYINIVFLFYCVIAGMLAFFEFMARQSIHPERGYLWINAEGIVPLVTIAALHFVLLYTGAISSAKNKYAHILLYVPFAIYMFFLVTTDTFRMNVVLKPWGFSSGGYEKKTFIQAIPVLWMLGLNLAAVILSFRFFMAQKVKKRRSAAFYVSVSMLLPFILAFVDNVILVKKSDTPELITIGTLLGAVFIAYAIFNHRLFEVSAERAAENIINTVDSFIVLADAGSCIIRANPAICSALGYRESELVGGKISEIFMDGFSADLSGTGGVFGKKTDVRNIESCLKTASGNPVYVIVSEAYIYDEMGDAQGFILAGTNIEERIILEKNLMSEIARTDLAIGKLAESNAKLKELDRMKKNFIAIVSHELRTPLTSIKGFISFMIHGVGGKLSEKQQEFAVTISGNVEKLLKLINELLDFSKIDSGTFSVDKKPGDLVAIIRKSMVEMSSIAEKKNIKILEEQCPDGLPAVFDETRIGQVIINLLNNAVKYTYNNTSMFVTVKYISEPASVLPAGTDKELFPAGKYCFLSVRDEGPGMDPKYCEQIFEQFYQIGDANNRKHEGVGLGLNISKNIIKAHDGFIWAESKGKDTGSVFCFIIPAGV